VIAYRGHEGGMDEFEAVNNWIRSNQPSIKVIEERDSQHTSGTGPYWWLMQKLPESGSE
jgi:hypothetical protein